MTIPQFVTNDIEKVQAILCDCIVHCGVFGSILREGEGETRDIDVLFVYSGTTFDDICRRLKGVQLAFPHVMTYRNYGGKIPKPPLKGKYYDLIFIPKNKPDRAFMAIIDGTVAYITDPFESWRKSPKSAGVLVG